MSTSLEQYGTPAGFAAWTLEEDLINADLDLLTRMLQRARSILHVYGPYDIGKPGFDALITELVYYTAEAMYVFGGLTKSIISPMRAERIGSYSYDKGDRKTAHKVIEDHDIIWPLILHLRSNSDPIAYSIRVEHLAPVNPETGIRDIFLAYNNRKARAIERLGLQSDTEQWNSLVYGDGGSWWP